MFSLSPSFLSPDKTKKSQHVPAVPGSQNPLLQEVTAMLRGEEWWLAQEAVENLGNSDNSKSKPESQTGAMPVMSGIPKENIPEIFLHRDKQVISVSAYTNDLGKAELYFKIFIL